MSSTINKNLFVFSIVIYLAAVGHGDRLQMNKYIFKSVKEVILMNLTDKPN